MLVHIVNSDTLELSSRDLSFTAGSVFKLLPGKQIENFKIDDVVNTLLDPFNLLLGLGEFDFCHSLDEFFIVRMSHFYVLAAWIEFDFLSGRKVCDKSL